MLSPQDQQDIYKIACRAVRDTMTKMRNEYISQITASRKRAPQSPQDRIIKIIKSAKRYTGDTRFDPAAFAAGWMYHSKLLKLSGFTALEFAEVVGSMIQDGILRVVTPTELSEHGIDAHLKLYALTPRKVLANS